MGTYKGEHDTNTFSRKINRQAGQRGKRFRPATSPSTVVARAIAETAIERWSPAQRTEALGQTGRRETLARGLARLSPRMARRLRRRSVALLQAQSRQYEIQAQQARKSVETSPVKTRCNARTRYDTQCRRMAVADGYCTQHGG